MLVGVDELKRYMSGLNMNVDQMWAADAILAGVQSDLEQFLGRVVEPVQTREAKYTDTKGWWNPTYTPVVAIVSVTQVGCAPAPADMFTDVSLDVMSAESIVKRPLLDWTGETLSPQTYRAGGINIGYPNTPYAIEYVSCYRGPLIASMKLGILRVASRELANKADDTVGVRVDQPENASKQDNRPPGWTPDELNRFLRAKRRVIV